MSKPLSAYTTNGSGNVNVMHIMIAGDGGYVELIHIPNFGCMHISRHGFRKYKSVDLTITNL